MKKIFTKRSVIILGISAILLAATALALEKSGVTNFYQNDPEPPTAQTETAPSTATEQEKIDMSPAQPTDNDAINKVKESGPGQQPPSTNSGITIVITRTTELNGIIQVRSMISGASSGACSLKLTKSDTLVEKSNALITLIDNTKSCQFDVPKNELSTGSWSAVISLSSADKVGQSEPRSIEVQ